MDPNTIKAGGTMFASMAVGIYTLLTVGDYIDTNKKVERCVTAYYSGGNYKTVSPDAFTKCMKSEFPRKFSEVALRFSDPEEFGASK